MRIIKMEKDAGTCEVNACGNKTQFMTDETGGASNWICMDHIRESRKVHGGH